MSKITTVEEPQTLPETLSALIRLAVTDLEKVEKDPRYRVNMYSWHEQLNQVCHVCLAGAVISQLPGVDPSMWLCPSSFTHLATASKLDLLNDIRRGIIYEKNFILAFPNLDALKAGSIDLNSEWPRPLAYEDNPKHFKARMHSYADQLESIGL